MLETRKLIEIISGKRHDPIAVLLRWGLGFLTPLYRVAIYWRNRRFDLDAKQFPHQRIKKAAVPVVSIGNITTGGTGKTPLVIWVARLVRSKNLRVAVISRGYGAEIRGQRLSRNDEALEMELRLPDVPHLQDPNRFHMAQIAVEELESQVLLLDDGFQHRQLHRDLDIVLIDSLNPVGYGRLLPRGLLREPLAGLQRADLVVLTRCNLVSAQTIKEIRERIIRYNGQVTIAQTWTRPKSWLQFDGREFPVDHLASSSVVAFCGIGNPEGFQKTLAELSLIVVDAKIFADHHNYSRDDLERISAEARNAGVSALVCTHKDLVKVGCNQLNGLPVFALLIDVEFQSGQQEFEATIIKTVTKS